MLLKMVMIVTILLDNVAKTAAVDMQLQSKEVSLSENVTKQAQHLGLIQKQKKIIFINVRVLFLTEHKVKQKLKHQT